MFDAEKKVEQHTGNTVVMWLFGLIVIVNGALFSWIRINLALKVQS